MRLSVQWSPTLRSKWATPWKTPTQRPALGKRTRKRTVSPTLYGPLWIFPNEVTPRLQPLLFTAPITYCVFVAPLDAYWALKETTYVEYACPCRGLTFSTVVADAPPAAGAGRAAAAGAVRGGGGGPRPEKTPPGLGRWRPAPPPP